MGCNHLGIEKTFCAPVLPDLPKAENVLNMVLDGGVRNRLIQKSLESASEG